MHRPTSFDIFPFTKLKTNQGLMLYYLSNYRYVLVQAPTGFGKTAVALSALLPELANNCQIIIATRTKSQLFAIYMKWLNRFRNQQALKDMTCVPLIARDDLCLASRPAEVSCQDCHILEYTEHVTSKTFKRLSECIRFSSTTLPEWHETLSDWGCPYQLIKRLCPFVDIVLMTQGYLVQRHLREKLFELTQAEVRPQSKLLLIDEIHGLAAPTIVAELPLETLKAAVTIYSRGPLIKFVEQCRYPGQVQRPRVRVKSVKEKK
ncbi:MAG: DEAD/DEAH box helicase [Candidatus Hermodarchaeota archaeon]